MFSDNWHVDFHNVYVYEIFCTDFESHFHLSKGKKKEEKETRKSDDRWCIFQKYPFVR